MRLYQRTNPTGRTATYPPLSYRTASRAPAIQPSMRERPPVTRHSLHVSREALETRHDLHPEFNAQKVFNPTSLDAPPSRHGYVQRWIVDATNPNATRSEQRNWFSKMRQGWALRDPETVPPSLKHLYPSVKLGDAQAAIRVAGSVLVEMPRNVAEQRRLAVNDRIQHLTRSIPESVQELARGTRGATGPLQVVDRVDTYRGRAPGVMAN